eukprot:SAG22_NODE_6966_length_790_cov_1.370478_1_plen_88_part_10
MRPRSYETPGFSAIDMITVYTHLVPYCSEPSASIGASWRPHPSHNVRHHDHEPCGGAVTATKQPGKRTCQCAQGGYRPLQCWAAEVPG